jgi:hypothetical protein
MNVGGMRPVGIRFMELHLALQIMGCFRNAGSLAFCIAGPSKV